jgi:arylformamidase
MHVPLPWSEMSGFDWRTATPEEVDYQYSPSKFAKHPLDQYLEEYRVRSTTVDAAGVRQAYKPLLIFIHGGYWQKLSAADSLFNGPDAKSEEIALHAVEYRLAPHASIAEMIDECIADVSRTITELEPTRVVLAGSSAGAHLAAMCTRDAFIASHVDGVALLSGIYDVRPLVVTPTNDPLHLTTESAADISPQLLPLPYVVPNALLAVGGHEPPEFIRQNAEFGERLLSGGSAVQILVEEHLDHFDLPYDLLKRGTKVGDWCLSILKGSTT